MIGPLHGKVLGLWRNIINSGTEIGPRGMLTKEVIGTQRVFSPYQWFIDFVELPLNYDYVRTELAWYAKGDKKDLSITAHAEIWKHCVDSMGSIQSNYGYYFNANKEYVIEVLKQDPLSRRAVMPINAWSHNYVDSPDVPCTMYMNFMIRGGALNMLVHMRSQDAVYGLRNDLPAFQAFKLKLADDLNLPPGNLYLNVDSLHIYERHFEKVKTVLLNPIVHKVRPYDPGNISEYERFMSGD